MFSRIIKDFFLKKDINKRLTKITEGSNDKINTIGILVDSTYFFDTEKVVEEIKAKQNNFKEIKVLYFNDSVSHKDSLSQLSFSYRDISWSGKIKVIEVQDFVSYPFDLLINFYDKEKLPLLYVSLFSKAKFKAGFEDITTNVGNHLIIKSDIKNYRDFISELFKYLKILNKL